MDNTILFNWCPFPDEFPYSRSELFGNENAQFFLASSQTSSRVDIKLCLASRNSSKIKAIAELYQKFGSTSSYSFSYARLEYENATVTWSIEPTDISTFNPEDCKVSIEITLSGIETAKPKPTIAPLDHQKGLTAQMSSLRLDSKFSDLSLVTTLDGREFAAHKLILSARSTVFEAMFSHGELQENVKNRVEIEDITGEVMEALLKYVYEGDIEDVEKLAGELLTAADKYNISLLVGQCIQSMMSGLSVENAARFFYYANLHQLADFKKSIADFIAKNKEAVRSSEGWKEFIKADAELMEELLNLLI